MAVAPFRMLKRPGSPGCAAVDAGGSERGRAVLLRLLPLPLPLPPSAMREASNSKYIPGARGSKLACALCSQLLETGRPPSAVTVSAAAAALHRGPAARTYARRRTPGATASCSSTAEACAPPPPAIEDGLE
eukprot:CAMPEP_0179069530 /NCGR_PEP_ID=MMETSP0796-20121207/30555_1 /TAXON_ID=73915 /ORGANISM="Pyrodinium bahamense, Strain pbaha01" /LENGTH=131 /DNA_ID=CAMNT_0020766599 /DNA_START=204 /DNA_END=597 /DNA_ORIENTATION=-